MTQREEKINKLIEKKSKINIKDCNDACKELYELYNDNNDAKVLVDYLFQGGAKVASQFITDYYPKIDREKQQAIANAIMNELNIKEDKVSKSGTGFSIVRELFHINDQENLLNILSKTLELAESGSGFTPSICKTFKIHFLDLIGKEILTLDYSTWRKIKSQRFLRMIKATEEDIAKTKFASDLDIWVEKYIGEEALIPLQSPETSEKTPAQNQPVEVEPVTTEVVVEKDPTSKKEDGHKEIKLDQPNTQVKELMETLKSATLETEKLFNMIFSKNISMGNLQAKLKDKEAELIGVKSAIERHKEQASAMAAELESLKERLKDQDAKIVDLQERLKESFQSDEISNNQELITLKKNIASTIKLQYEDYMQNKDAECNEDNYQALKVNLNNVFRALDRFGIEL